MIESSRNNKDIYSNVGQKRSEFKLGNQQQLNSTIEKVENKYQTLPAAPSSAQQRCFDRDEYDRHVSQRRKEKICNLKVQLHTMLSPSQVTTPASYLTSNQLTPDNKRDFQLEKMLQKSSSASKLQESQRHSALKSRPAAQQLIPPRPDGQTVFKLVTAAPPYVANSISSSESKSGGGFLIKLSEVETNHNSPHLLVPSASVPFKCNMLHQTESKFSIYTYSDTCGDQPSENNNNNYYQGAQQLVNRIESHMEGEASITFISSKFIKSNSVESLPDIQLVVEQSPQHLKVESIKILNQEILEQSPASPSSLEQRVMLEYTNTYKKQRNRSENIANQLDDDITSNSARKKQQAKFRVSPSLQQSQARPLSRGDLKSPSPSRITDIFKKEDLQKAQIAMMQCTDEQIRKMPVLYVNELRRLARTINRVFGADSYFSQ